MNDWRELYLGFRCRKSAMVQTTPPFQIPIGYACFLHRSKKSLIRHDSVHIQAPHRCVCYIDEPKELWARYGQRWFGWSPVIFACEKFEIDRPQGHFHKFQIFSKYPSLSLSSLCTHLCLIHCVLDLMTTIQLMFKRSSTLCNSYAFTQIVDGSLSSLICVPQRITHGYLRGFDMGLAESGEDFRFGSTRCWMLHRMWFC